MKRICVFCGSSMGTNPVYAVAARGLGTEIARRGLGLVYGGAQVGLMGVVADAVLAGGGSVIGVIPDVLMRKELAHPALTELRVVGTMHQRKAQMADLADAFVALPGGMGTFEEYCEVVTWAQLGLHRKPCALLNVAGFYDPLLALVNNAVEVGFIRTAQRGLVLAAPNIPTLFDLLADYTPPESSKWISDSQT